MAFTGQYQTEGIAIAYDKAAYPEEKPVPAYFRFDTVAVENDSIADFYLSNPIARASQLMAELSANAKARREKPLAAE